MPKQKIFKEAYIWKLLNQVHREKITFSRFVEILNKKAEISKKENQNSHRPQIITMEKETSINQKTNNSDSSDVMGSFLFDKSLLKKAIIKQPEYVIGVDTSYNKDALAYSFGRKVDGVFEIMLSKTMSDEKEFNQEVENLVKYFNASVFLSDE